MSRKLYVHVGPPKTGTTAIQGALAKHDNSVVIYPKVGLATCGAHHNLIWNFRGRGGQHQFVKEDINTLFSEFGRAGEHSTLNFLLSSEALFPMGAGPESIASELEQFIGELLPHVYNGEDLEVEILIACREHFERAASYYSNKIRHRLKKALKTAPDEFLVKSAQDLCYADKLRELEKLGFRITVLNYHPRDTWLRRFFCHVGFSDHNYPTAGDGNFSYSPAALIARLAANQVLSTDTEVRAFLAPLRKSPGFRAPSQYLFGRRAATVADTIFRIDRDYLRETYRVEFNSPDVESEVDAFFLDVDSFARIAAAAAPLGPDGELILKAVREFLRE